MWDTRQDADTRQDVDQSAKRRTVSMMSVRQTEPHLAEKSSRAASNAERELDHDASISLLVRCSNFASLTIGTHSRHAQRGTRVRAQTEKELGTAASDNESTRPVAQRQHKASSRIFSTSAADAAVHSRHFLHRRPSLVPQGAPYRPSPLAASRPEFWVTDTTEKPRFWFAIFPENGTRNLGSPTLSNQRKKRGCTPISMSRVLAMSRASFST